MIDADRATTHLAAADPVMARLIERCGPFALRDDTADPFRALCRSIIFQQLSGKAAGTIFGRFVGLFGLPPEGDAFPAPGDVAMAADADLRAAGLSRQKMAAVRDLAAHFVSGDLGETAFRELDDEAVIQRLTAVRGIGRWTAEMYLMFHLQRPDVLPVNDVGINRAMQREYGLAEPPAPAEVLRIGAAWRPWATVGCWYLWRSEDDIAPFA